MSLSVQYIMLQYVKLRQADQAVEDCQLLDK